MKNCMDCIYAKVSPYREATRFEPAEFPEFDYCNNTEVDDEVLEIECDEERAESCNGFEERIGDEPDDGGDFKYHQMKEDAGE